MSTQFSFEQLIQNSIENGVNRVLDQLKVQDQRLFLTPQNLSEILKKDESTVRRMCRDGKIKYYKFGRSLRVEPSDFDDYCKRNRIE